MNDTQVYSQLNEIFREVFDDEGITVDAATTAHDVEGWDSAAHVSLIVAAEMKFGIRFRTAELDSLHNVGDFAQLIQSKVGA
ncbi:acyl carrier protein [Pseudoroseomonas deserti]|uniref:Acyl carrier protein n=1 Tax=Teichococcus deserti TaxID=1817963 RepID=A0A1V2H8X7_9PROT|nr:acyl carrier protein [Pseudoroseomonas deserti]ONG58944.1 acyl carrier protein [Pseudoroseomonas deserti]